MLLSYNFFMNAKILDSTQFYKFDFHKKVVTQKNLPLQAFATSTLRNSIERRALGEIRFNKIYDSFGELGELHIVYLDVYIHL